MQDPAKVKRLVLETADYLDSILRHTLAAMNDGVPPHVDILQRSSHRKQRRRRSHRCMSTRSSSFATSSAFYGGWWSGRTSELKPGPRAPLAR